MAIHLCYSLTRCIKITTLGLLAFVLVACAGRTVDTVDRSVDYKSAKSLPPLIKPSSQADPAPQVSSGTVSQTAAGSGGLAVVESDDPGSQTSVLAQGGGLSGAGGAVDGDGQRAQTNSSTSLSESDTQKATPSARVIEDNGASRLSIDADFDVAWEFLTNNLKRSDITVFTRNKSAGRFSIGCGALETAPKVSRSGGWSIFTRDKSRGSDYCALQVAERRGVSFVQVLNRAGDEVGSEFSNDVYKRILNN